MRFISIAVLIFLFSYSHAQTLTGNWYGKADVVLNGTHNNYLTEMVIKQKGNDLEGIFGYYFRDGYKSFFIRGTYNKSSKRVVFKNLPLTYFRSASIDGVDCIMDFSGTTMSSKVQTTLTGFFTSDSKHKYTCPDIRITCTLDLNERNQDSLIKNSIARKLWQPRQEDVVISEEHPATQPVAQHDTAKKDLAIQSLVDRFKKRETVLSKEVEVESDSIRVSFYDNGDIDGDSISVFLNKVPILTKQALTAQAVNVYIKLDPAKDVNELTMFAENLGSIPPNTALMVVNDGEHRYEVYLSSSLSQNASVRLRKKKSR